MLNQMSINMKTQYRFIHFVKKISGDWACVTSNHRNRLGTVEFYMPWKQWVFSAIPLVIFSEDCLDDVRHFIHQLNGDIEKAKR